MDTPLTPPDDMLSKELKAAMTARIAVGADEHSVRRGTVTVIAQTPYGRLMHPKVDGVLRRMWPPRTPCRTGPADPDSGVDFLLSALYSDAAILNPQALVYGIEGAIEAVGRSA